MRSIARGISCIDTGLSIAAWVAPIGMLIAPPAHAQSAGTADASNADAARPTSTAAGKAVDGGSVEAVVVTARKSSVVNKVDRRVYDVSAGAQADMATVNDVLSRIPSVTIDPRGAIALRGNSQVKVLVDGREAGANVIRNLPASQIERVEVTTNPSAQYGSEGAGGIINIIPKTKRADGWSGIWSARADADGRYNLDASASHRAGRWTYDGSVGLSQTRTIVGSANQERWNEGAAQARSTTSDDLTEQERRGGRLNAAVKYQASDHDKISLTVSANEMRSQDDETSMVVQTGQTVAASRAYTDQALTTGRNRVAQMDASWEHLGGVKDERLTLSVSGGKTTSRETMLHQLSFSAPQSPPDTYLQTTRAPETEIEIRADYERPLAHRAQLTAGLFFGTLDSENHYASQSLAVAAPGARDLAGLFDYDRTSAAAYITYQTPVGKWVIMPGLRVESERWTARESTTGGSGAQDDWRWLPSLNLSRQISDDWKLVASYSHRTRKPSLYQLNPRTYYSTASAYRGNPRLRTQDTDSFEIGYEYGRRRFSSEGSLYYRRNEHEITPTRALIDDQIILSSFVNAAGSHSVGAEFTAKGELSSRLNYSLNINVFDTQLTGVVGDVSLRREAVTYSGNAIVELKPTRQDWVQLSLNAQGKTPTLQGYTTGYARLDLTYRHRLARHWIFSARGFDLTNSSKQRTVFSTPDGASQSVRSTQRPGIMLGVAYRFGADTK